MKLDLFPYYSWIANILNSILEITPPLVKCTVFKLLLNHFGKNSFIDYKCYLRNMKKISIGSFVYINRGCQIFASHHIKDAYIIIEDHVTIAPNVVFLGAGHDYAKLSLPDLAKTITVCKNVWIGANSIILHGVTIGEGAIIGAGSLVTRNIPPYTVAVGRPARVIKTREILNDK